MFPANVDLGTILLGSATAALVFVTGALAYFTRRLANSTSVLARHAKEQANVMMSGEIRKVFEELAGTSPTLGMEEVLQQLEGQEESGIRERVARIRELQRRVRQLDET